VSAATPLARTTKAVDHTLRLFVWGSQVSTAAIYLTIATQPDAWRSLYATDTVGAICGGMALLALVVLWPTCLYAEQRRFYDRVSRRFHHKIGLLAHAGVLVFALGVLTDRHQWFALWAVPALCTLPAVIVWHAWMRALALPPEDQAAVDAIIKKEAQEAAARFDAVRKEQRRERLHAIVTGLGHHLVDIEVDGEGRQAGGAERPTNAATPWPIPPRKHQPLVYLLRNGNRIKIGTTTELKRRIRTLALRPENVVLLLDGGQQLERELHRRFARLRIGDTEWFAYDGPLIDFVHTENARAARKGDPK
jgi:hypothetical protein